tara:strand:- start:2258 stop:3001 length:744 start_codon:yes stop_codon:yes gene_type:complete
MSDELLADTSAPEQVATAAPETEVSTPEAEAPKTFTQEELDAIVSKRLAREQRKWERQQQQPVKAPVELPPADQFESVEAYADALAARKADKMIEQRELSARQAEMLDAYHDREEEARAKYDDFEQVAYNPNLPITNVMAETIQASDIGPDLAYYLGANPKEADRISRLSPFLQAKEIGRLEAKLVTEPMTKQVSKAPEPISPVKPRGATTPVIDTTDPRSIKSMSVSEWIEADRQRQMKKAEARNR